MVITAKDDGLWSLMEGVSAEDVRHMQSRVEQFTATEKLSTQDLVDVPLCKESWAKWVVSGAAAFSARSVPAQPILPVADARHVPVAEKGAFGIHGFAELANTAFVSGPATERLHGDMVALGAVSIQELAVEDWKALPSWPSVPLFEQRRILAFVQ
jgi:hypothetical protein